MTGFDSEAQSKRISFFVDIYERATAPSCGGRKANKQAARAVQLFSSLYGRLESSLPTNLFISYSFSYFSPPLPVARIDIAKARRKSFLFSIRLALQHFLPPPPPLQSEFNQLWMGKQAKPPPTPTDPFFFLLFGRVYINHDQWWRVECPGAID